MENHYQKDEPVKKKKKVYKNSCHRNEFMSSWSGSWDIFGIS